jgi:alpha-glucosidase (family GH31 glycosyl hydrolase)
LGRRRGLGLGSTSHVNFHRIPSRDRTPWNVGETSGDDRVVPLFRRLVQLREALVPYLSAEADKAIRTSRPLMRGLFFDSEDERQWRFPYQFLLGDDLLVAPVVEPGVEEQEVFLPDGAWIHAWDGTRCPGGSILKVDAPVGQIPVFATARRADRILPLFRGSDPSSVAHAAPVEVT